MTGTVLHWALSPYIPLLQVINVVTVTTFSVLCESSFSSDSAGSSFPHQNLKEVTYAFKNHVSKVNMSHIESNYKELTVQCKSSTPDLWSFVAKVSVVTTAMAPEGVLEGKITYTYLYMCAHR